MHYTEEKALYLAQENDRLHVDYYEEQRETTLWGIVMKAQRQGYLVLLAEDDSGYYFGITQVGQMRLLELRIAWREDKGKDASEQRAQLDALRKAK